MKEIVDAIGTRIKSPYFGYALFAFLALNWEAIFILLLSDSTPRERVLCFKEETSTWTLLVLPLFFGFVVALMSPWIKYIFELISRKPFELTDTIKIVAQHKNTVKQVELEQSRADLFAIKENELIERAKRDEEVAEITDEETKSKLSKELDSLRKERDRLSTEIGTNRNITNELSETAIELISQAAKDKYGTIILLSTLEGRSFQVGGKMFGNKDAREFAKYEAGLEELLYKGFVKPRGSKGEMFELTSKGWELSEKL